MVKNEQKIRRKLVEIEEIGPKKEEIGGKLKKWSRKKEEIRGKW